MRTTTTVLAAAVALLLGGCAADVGSDAPNATDLVGLGREPSGYPTKYPIVLAHGFDASPTNRWGFKGVAEALEKDGHRVYVATVPPYQSPSVRAEYLSAFVDEAIADGAEKVNIIAHSMGGLDARYLVSTLGYADVVASLTTISTPHGGTYVADKMIEILDGLDVDEDFVNELAKLWGLTYNDLAGNTDVRAALEALSEARAPLFRDRNPNIDGVYYQSWAGVSSLWGIKNPADWDACGKVILGDYEVADALDGSLELTAGVVAHGWHAYPNDGMARVESAKWGNFRGCLPADHLDEVGYEHDGPDPRTRFDHVRFYRNVAFELASMDL